MRTPFHLLGYAYGQAAGDSGCGDGPDAFKESVWFKKLIQRDPSIIWDTTFSEQSTKPADKYFGTQAICERLANKTYELTKKKHRFVVIGGDHSSAIGTWSGVCKSLKGDLGLIWIDAHMDSHTPETTPSGNIHGMPLATLLGYGDSLLTQMMNSQPKLLPENVCLIGIRSFEPGESDLLKRLGIRVFYMPEINERGLDVVFAEALALVRKNTCGFGVSIDLDAIDPREAPGVGTPEANGLNGDMLSHVLTTVAQSETFLGGEIVEFNPHHDKNHLTEKLIYQLICSMNKRV